jgi:hypothetical protein
MNDFSKNFEYTWNFRGTICGLKCVDVKANALSQTTFLYFENDIKSEQYMNIIIAVQSDRFWNKPHQEFVDLFEKQISSSLIPKIKDIERLRLTK